MDNYLHTLIGLYCYICDAYHTRLFVNVQRLSNNNRPLFSDPEVLTVYLWGLSQRLFSLKSIYTFTKTYLLDYFPKLPSYQAFSRRLSDLNPALLELAELLISSSDKGGLFDRDGFLALYLIRGVTKRIISPLSVMQNPYF